MMDDLSASWDEAHRIDQRHNLYQRDGRYYDNMTRGMTLRITKLGRGPANNGLRPHCWKCAQGQPLLNFYVYGTCGNRDEPAAWLYLTFKPKSPCARGYQGKELICTRAFHSSWFEIIEGGEPGIEGRLAASEQRVGA
jgi:hypothetical protein